MNDDELFDELDLDGDGFLARDDLRQAAVRLGWSRHEAPLYALLDFLTIRRPLDRSGFVSSLEQLTGDPQGIYGEVLRREAHAAITPTVRPADAGTGTEIARSGPWREQLAGTLRTLVGDWAADDMEQSLDALALPTLRVRTGEAALLAIDPQHAFSAGDWMRSLGTGGAAETEPIRIAFDNCARLLEPLDHLTEVMFTRCPFPPGSYDWDERLAGLVDPAQPYFIKPGNSVLRPDSNGCREWMERLLGRGVTTLVMGGCTLTSCVRVSAMETANLFRDSGLTVVVDLALCGARTGAYLSTPQFDNMSPVESAIWRMMDAGATVAESVVWVV